MFFWEGKGCCLLQKRLISANRHGNDSFNPTPFQVESTVIDTIRVRENFNAVPITFFDQVVSRDTGCTEKTKQ